MDIFWWAIIKQKDWRGDSDCFNENVGGGAACSVGCVVDFLLVVLNWVWVGFDKDLQTPTNREVCEVNCDFGDCKVCWVIDY